jgi:hypothetical protein
LERRSPSVGSSATFGDLAAQSAVFSEPRALPGLQPVRRLARAQALLLAPPVDQLREPRRRR